VEFRLTASPRHRLEAYSLPMTLLLARIPPMPMPVKTRSSPSCVADALTDDRSIPTAAIAKQIRIIGRRPMRSAHGASSIDPSAIPTRPAESRRPSCAPLSPHSVDTAFPVKAMTSTSKPSSMLRRTQTAIANHWKRDIGPSCIEFRSE
jgi:hypothetical protein